MPKPFLERTFHGGGKERCTVRFFKPIPDGEDFRCNFEIDHGRSKRSHRVLGIDAIQAMILAMSVVQAELEAWGKANKKELTWLGESDLGLLRWTKQRQLVLADIKRKRPPNKRA